MNIMNAHQQPQWHYCTSSSLAAYSAQTFYDCEYHSSRLFVATAGLRIHRACSQPQQRHVSSHCLVKFSPLLDVVIHLSVH